MWVSSGRGSE
ncbi:unnamed protein product [Linum tenue]|uniref:Uncharacterized protein n=1 Tax=Linum tenue TaxID=586396 RepID=A0AAV0NVD4_9ROSI|nr:unnamed protein product [Linum tenue]CAI0462437.1 unnamed protein product [Linum tenue]